MFFVSIVFVDTNEIKLDGIANHCILAAVIKWVHLFNVNGKSERKLEEYLKKNQQSLSIKEQNNRWNDIAFNNPSQMLYLYCIQLACYISCCVVCHGVSHSLYNAISVNRFLLSTYLVFCVYFFVCVYFLHSCDTFTVLTRV